MTYINNINNINSFQNWWRLSKYDLQNIFDIHEIKERYVALQQKYFAGTPDGKKTFKKYFDRVRKFVKYYACGGLEYLRDKDYSTISFSGLRIIPPNININSFEELSKKAHELNWIVIRGKHYPLPKE